MEDRDWLILKLLHEQKNITKTAQALYISQPALTARLRQIEDEFGVKIVLRGSHGVVFTPQGEYLAQAANDYLPRLRQIKEQVLNIDNTVAGTLRLGATNFVTKYILPRLLSRFKDRYPNVEFNVTTSWSKEILNSMYNQDFHVGFIRSDYDWHYEKHLLFEETICIASKNQFAVSDLPRLPRIEYRTDPLAKAVADSWWREHFSRSPLVSMNVNQIDTCKEMVMSGLGYGVFASRILDGLDCLHKIDITDKAGKPITRRTWMIYQAEELEIHVVQAFVDFVKSIDFNQAL